LKRPQAATLKLSKLPQTHARRLILPALDQLPILPFVRSQRNLEARHRSWQSLGVVIVIVLAITLDDFLNDVEAGLKFPVGFAHKLVRGVLLVSEDVTAEYFKFGESFAAVDAEIVHDVEQVELILLAEALSKDCMVLPLNTAGLVVDIELEFLDKRLATPGVLQDREFALHAVEEPGFVDVAIQASKNLLTPVVPVLLPVGIEYAETIRLVDILQ
jgi:hypothetical protein